jgi:hypothetical protein
MMVAKHPNVPEAWPLSRGFENGWGSLNQKKAANLSVTAAFCNRSASGERSE